MAASKPYPLRLTEAEREMLQKVADHHDSERSDLLRWLLRQEARRIGLIDGDTPTAPAVPQQSVENADGPLGFD